MGGEPGEIAELTERIAAILELPEGEQPEAFRRFRAEHPERRAFLIRCEAVASRLAPGGDLRASLVRALAGFGSDDGAMPEGRAR